MRLFLILIQCVYLISCNEHKNNTKPKYLFYEGYSEDTHKGIILIDTLRIKIQNLNIGYYFIEELINDSVSYIYFVQNKKISYLDTSSCDITIKLRKGQNILYVGRKNDIYLSTEKNLFYVSGYYEKDSVTFYVDEKIVCVPKFGEEKNEKKLSATIILRGASIETFSFCLSTIDTINLIENFKTLEKFNSFKIKLQQ